MAKRPAEHPVERAIRRMLPRNQRIAERLAEEGHTDEDLYAALPNPGVEFLLANPPQGKEEPK